MLHNKKVTRRSVNALANHPIPLSSQVPIGRKNSINSNKDKIKSPKDFEHPGTKTRSHRHYSEDQGNLVLIYSFSRLYKRPLLNPLNFFTSKLSKSPHRPLLSKAQDQVGIHSIRSHLSHSSSRMSPLRSRSR